MRYFLNILNHIFAAKGVFLVSRAIVLETIKRMYASGVDDETVKSTLRDIGLTDSEITNYLAEAKGESQTQSAPKKPMQGFSKPAPKEEEKEELDEDSASSENSSGKEDDDLGFEEGDAEGLGEEDFESESDSLAERTASKIKESLDDHLDSRELSHETAMNALEEHGQNLSSIHQKIDVLHEKISSGPSISPQMIAQINSIEKKVIALEKELGEIKASENALQSLLKKILEANQSILNKMKK